MNRFFTLLFAASCLTAVGQYQVGDVGPAGGWIFYVDSIDAFDWDYLEVASSVELPAPNWGGYAPCGTDGSNSLALGSGAFFSAFCLGEASPSTIASLSTGGPGALVNGNGCSQGGYGDWFLPSLEELDQIRLAFGDGLVNMIAWDDYVPNIFSCWTSSFYHLDNCSIRGIHSNILDGSYGGQESTGNHWGSGDYLRHQVLPIRSFSKANEAACGIGTIWDPFSQTCIVDESACGWQPDGNGDNLIGVNDLLDLLGVYGDTDYDQDGIWDSADDCVGEYDECGVCNGSGPSIPIIESIEILYDSVYAEPIDEWLVFEVGADTTFSFTCFEWQCGDPLEYQGYDYETVQIGEQCWFAENLRAENYRNGDAIPSPSDWGTYNAGAQTVYDFDVENLATYGRLYNYHAGVDSRGLCPSGWQVPSDFEWFELINGLGGGTEAEDAMKASVDDEPGWSGSNISGFTGLPGGSRDDYAGLFQQGGTRGYWWSTTWYAEGAGVHRLGGSPFYWRFNSTFGLSVRCIKDTE
jgi:uncharacterized protein (TIGR02145 family)